MNAKSLKLLGIYFLIVIVFYFASTKFARTSDYVLPVDSVSVEFLALVEELETLSIDVDFISSQQEATFKTPVSPVESPPPASIGRVNPFRVSSSSPFSAPSNTTGSPNLFEGSSPAGSGDDSAPIEGGVIDR